jgi:hypothetical protein
VGCQRPDVDAARHGRLQRTGNVASVESEDQDVDGFLGLLDGGEDRRNAGIWLNQQLHRANGLAAVTAGMDFLLRYRGTNLESRSLMARMNASKLMANPSVSIVAVSFLLIGLLAFGVIAGRWKTQSPETSMPAPAETPKAARDLAARGAEGLEPHGAVFDRFEARAKDYILLQKRIESGLAPLKPTDDPRRLADHRNQLARQLRDARPVARPGDIFSDAAPAIRAITLEDSKRREAADVYAAMQEVPPQAPPAVNADYPAKAPLANVPPLLLLKLPPLPDGLEYRFMGRDLILRDAKANLIVDFVPEAVPTVGR